MMLDLTVEEALIVKQALSLLSRKAIFSDFSLSCFDEDGNIEYFTTAEGAAAEQLLEKMGRRD